MSSFHESAEQIRVDDGHMLRARLRNGNGDMVDAEYDLDQCLGNSDGRFDWGGQNFSGSAQDVTFAMEGDAQVPVLRATLLNGGGEPVQSDVNLAERIGNEDGQFVFA